MSIVATLMKSTKINLAEHILVLEQEIADLRRQVELLQQKPQPTEAGPVPVSGKLTEEELAQLPEKVRKMMQYIGWSFRLADRAELIEVLEHLDITGEKGARLISFDREYYKNNPAACRLWLQQLAENAPKGNWRMSGTGLIYTP